MLILVSNEEIKRRLQAKRKEPIVKNKRYLVCDKCKGSYELHPGESPDDFKDKCECGGNLYATDSINNDVDDLDAESKWDKIWKTRLDEKQEERVEKSKAYKKKHKNSGNVPWGIIATVILALIVYSFFGIIGLAIVVVIILIAYGIWFN